MSTTSSRNPFRNGPTENVTGSSTVSQNPHTPPVPQRSIYAPPTEPPPPQRQQETSPIPAAQPSPAVSNPVIPVINESNVDAYADVDLEDLPPPYTASADRYTGETTVEYGPSRPFQPAPQPMLQVPPNQYYSQGPAPTAQSHRYIPPERTGGTGLMPPVPPPRHPSTVSSSYARRTESERRPSSSNSYTVPGSYPPPGPLPPPLERRSSSVGSSPLAVGSGPSSSSGPGEISNDGKPTRLPVPGHPLLNNGRVLVYPEGYMCYKCDNIGYKNFDPTHPCRKCWERYSKPYTGALQYATWSQAPANFQRPLPTFHSPSQTPMQSVPSNSYQAPAHVAFSSGPPPPGALVVRPGDPRIGGRICWNCDGTGVVSLFLLFDSERCPMCNGMGRIFR